jgi:hypothetical protein
MTIEELRETARRLLARDCAAQGVEPVCTDPEELAVVAALMRPHHHRLEGGEADGAPAT